jgi:DNA-binding MarR family transcriptional regulator
MTSSPTDATARLIFDVLRLANALTVAGDALVAPLGLTSARWQVLGTLAHQSQPTTMAGLARVLGLTRQAVQRVVGEMRRAGLVELQENPEHKRAGLVVLTPEGRAAHDKADALRVPWTEGLAAGLDELRVARAGEVVRTLRETLDRRRGRGEP